MTPQKLSDDEAAAVLRALEEQQPSALAAADFSHAELIHPKEPSCATD
jgi:hypothetical protein